MLKTVKLTDNLQCSQITLLRLCYIFILSVVHNTNEITLCAIDTWNSVT